jgi:Pectate lyase superfamily protein
MQPLPDDMPVSVDLKTTYGAIGDGVADDTPALLAALDDITDQAVIYLPPGTYRLTGRIDISKRVVLRGAGRNETTLLLVKSLTELYGNRWTGGASQYTYGPSLINFWGTGRTDASTLLSTVPRCEQSTTPCLVPISCYCAVGFTSSQDAVHLTATPSFMYCTMPDLSQQCNAWRASAVRVQHIQDCSQHMGAAVDGQCQWHPGDESSWWLAAGGPAILRT